jgi:hypothetical protein
MSSRLFRLARLGRLRARRRFMRWTLPLWRVNTWMLLAAAALVGFEGLELLLGMFLLAPEVLPLVLLALAVYGACRKHAGRGIRRLRTRMRASRRLRRIRGS